jgi:hypothetical protein
MLYARHNPNEPGSVEIRDFDAPPPEGKGWVQIDPPPAVASTQVLVRYDFGAGWIVRDKTAAELALDAEATEREQLKAAAVMDLLRAEAAGTSSLTAAQARKLFARCVLYLVNRL